MSKYWTPGFSDEQNEEEQNEAEQNEVERNEEEQNEVEQNDVEHIEVQLQAPIVKPSLARRIKKTYKVKRFKSEWLGNYLDGVQVKTWLVADPADPKQAKCTVCPAPADSPFRGRTFSITERFSAIRTHCKPRFIRQLLRTQTNTT